MFNPLLVKEIRTRLRGKTVFIVQNLYLAFILFMVIGLIREDKRGWVAGYTVFYAIATFQVICLSIIIPAIAASALTIEKEQKTFDMLLTTPLKEWQIIWNKLIASVSYFLILLFVFVPTISVTFILGGVSLGQIFMAFLVTLDALLLAGIAAMYCSTIFKRTLSAVPVSMIAVAVLFFTVMVLGEESYPALGMLSPFAAIDEVGAGGEVGFFDRIIAFWIPHLIQSGLLFGALFLATVEGIKPKAMRNMTGARVMLWLALASMFIFAAGSLNYFKSDTNDISRDIHSLFSFYFIICLSLALILGGGPISNREFIWLREKSFNLITLVKKLFGGTIFSAAPFTVLVAVTAGAAVTYALSRYNPFEEPLHYGTLLGLVLVSFNLMICLFSGMLRRSPRIPSSYIPQLAAFLLFLSLASIPQYISDRAHAKYEDNTRADIVLFLDPRFATNSILWPDQIEEDNPYCKEFVGPYPVAIVSSLIYFLMASVFALISVRQEYKMKQYSSIELFYQKKPEIGMRSEGVT